MELVDEIRAVLNSPSDKRIRELYLAVFGTSIKKDCNNCYNEAIYRLMRHYKREKNKAMDSNCKYRIAEKSRHKTFFISVSGTLESVTAETLTDATAEAIIASGKYRDGVIEMNPNYVPGAEKKMDDTKSQSPTSSISKEAPSGGVESTNVVKKKESPVSELPPVKERKKPGPKPKGKK